MPPATVSPASNARPWTGVSYEEFLANVPEDVRAEWVDGEAILMPPPSIAHQLLSAYLVRVLGFYVEEHRLGIVLHAPVQMRAADFLPGREPDLVVVLEAHRDRIKKNHIEGPADLVVEIISPESRGRDRGDKHYEYETGGVTEYWLLDPMRQSAEFYLRNEAGQFILATCPEGIFESRVLAGMKFQVEWLWTQPRLAEVMRAWGM